VSGFDPTTSFPVWFARTPGPGPGMHLACVMGDEHPYRHVIDLDDLPPLASVLYRADYGADGEMTKVAIDPAFAAGAVDLWYSEIPEPEADPPATNLVAFATGEWPDGTIVGPEEREDADTDLRAQAAALRWWTGTGQVHQIYVIPHMRRRGIGSKLVLAGAALTVGRRWPSLWSNGDLTDLGSSWISASVWSPRVAPRTSVMPPMTPGGDPAPVTPDA
jgi:GNAT superfamily N-acetyltransferase